ncbi:MAG: ABC transporter ATP-binding protein [Lachnospiraceae bacterium]|nr:ABC transporter ATP-binding protein [Lachnospiraceae bacterium]
MLQVKDIRKQYKNFELNCSMEMMEGCITGLIGQNGAGKSTMFKAILNLIHLDGGEIMLFGKEHRNLTNRDREKIGVVLSDSTFPEVMTPREIASVLDELYEKFDKNDFCRRCEEKKIPLEKPLKEFSTGMKAKLKVLTALSHQSQFLILDEPTSGLDVVARGEVLDLLREYMEEQEDHSILISSHISSDLEGLCDDVYMIHQGKIILHEETDTILSNYGLLKVDEKQYQTLEKRYVLRVKKEPFGYQCLTNERQFYMENYPGIVAEKGTIDQVIEMMIQGEEK